MKNIIEEINNILTLSVLLYYTLPQVFLASIFFPFVRHNYIIFSTVIIYNLKNMTTQYYQLSIDQSNVQRSYPIFVLIISEAFIPQFFLIVVFVTN